MAEFLVLARPSQWVKNGFVLAALVFSGRFLEGPAFVRAVSAFVLFCMASSAAYMLNDVLDAERDRKHPAKRNRPIAAGTVSPSVGLAGAALLALASGAGALVLDTSFAACLGAFLALQIAYSTLLKHIAVADTVSIATGFVLRTLGGVLAVGSRISPWLLACTFFLALFLALGKRRHELVVLKGAAGGHRAVLETYSATSTDALVVASAGAAAALYCLYSFSPGVAERLGTDQFWITCPFVVFGVLRYLFLLFRRDQGENPTDVFLRDRPLQIGVIAWLGTVFVLLYR